MNPLRELLAEPRLERMAGFNGDRERLAALTVKRVVEAKRLAAGAAGDPRALELVLNEACFLEEQRFKGQRKLDEDDKKLRARLGKLRRSIRHLSEAELGAETAALVRHYTDDIVGNFNPAVYAFASRALPVLLSVFFTRVQLGRSLSDLSQLRERVLIEGQVADIARLAERGTLILVPTHLSNVDSIAIGFALERTGLPPVTYGAGKNLFDNPLLAFFMRNLGAYRVDRRIKTDLYKETLKSYSAVLLEGGYHSLFFPGGTRSRSGAIETRLKLGLLGTAIDAHGEPAADSMPAAPVAVPPVEPTAKPKRPSRIPWADLLQKVFAIDVFCCDNCGGRRRVISAITDAAVAQKILLHLDLPTRAPDLLPARAPPSPAQLELAPPTFDPCCDPPCMVE